MIAGVIMCFLAVILLIAGKELVKEGINQHKNSK